jgi:hypothetical protein
MHTYNEALKLALMSARNARFTSNKQTARELWERMLSVSKTQNLMFATGR